MPTVVIINPRSRDKRPFKRASFEMDAVAAKAKTISAKYSGGPNFRANLATGRARKTKIMVDISPPIKDAIAEIARAVSACPFLAIGYPSKQDATAAPSPGTFNRIELLEPPNIAP
jgi:hypothetical protein